MTEPDFAAIAALLYEPRTNEAVGRNYVEIRVNMAGVTSLRALGETIKRHDEWFKQRAL